MFFLKAFIWLLVFGVGLVLGWLGFMAGLLSLYRYLHIPSSLPWGPLVEAFFLALLLAVGLATWVVCSLFGPEHQEADQSPGGNVGK
jgi:hypothetical protein